MQNEALGAINLATKWHELVAFLHLLNKTLEHKLDFCCVMQLSFFRNCLDSNLLIFTQEFFLKGLEKGPLCGDGEKISLNCLTVMNEKKFVIPPIS